MKGTASHLLEFLEGARKRFIIPVYQRNYDWKRENCKQLFDDLGTHSGNTKCLTLCEHFSVGSGWRCWSLSRWLMKSWNGTRKP